MRELRAARFVSIEEFAKAAKRNRVHVGYLENGQREPSLATLLILAEALDVPAQRLVAGLPAPTRRRGHRGGVGGRRAPRPAGDVRLPLRDRGPVTDRLRE